MYDCNLSDPLDYEKATSRATKMLLEGQATKVLPLINRTIDFYPNSIQPWINKGMALLQLPDPDVNELESICSKVEKLKEGKFSYLHAKVYFTFWLWEMSPLTFESHVKALESFESILEECGEDPDVRMVSLQSCLYSAKTIYRLLRSFSDEDEEEEWMTENKLVEKGFEMLKALGTSESAYYKVEFWVWLSEFQQLRHASSPWTDEINECLSVLKTKTGYEDCDHDSDLLKMEDSSESVGN